MEPGEAARLGLTICPCCGKPKRPRIPSGLGTALKPAMELIACARKPLSEPNVAANVLRWGTGALAINAARVHPCTMDRLLSHARHIALRAACEFGDNTFGTSPAPSEDEFRCILDNALRGAGALLRVGGHEAESGRNDSRLPDSLDGCPVCLHFCDALVRMAVAAAQEVPQPLRCVHTRIHPSTRAGDRVREQLDSRLSECMSRLASLGCVLESEDRAGMQSEVWALRHAVLQYLGSCLDYIGTSDLARSMSRRAGSVARFLVPDPEQIASESDRLGWDSPCHYLLVNILAGPYIITNTLDLAIAVLESNGRWPANVLLDEEAAEMLDEQSGFSRSCRSKRGAGLTGSPVYGSGRPDFDSVRGYDDYGGASRFFYVAKASKSERGEYNTHPTVKPLTLMRYLVRLITPPSGTVLDPFAGSGSTLIAAMLEGFRAVGIEKEPKYVEIAKHRIAEEQAKVAAQPSGLFASVV